MSFIPPIAETVAEPNKPERKEFQNIPTCLIDPVSQREMRRKERDGWSFWECEQTGAVFVDGAALAEIIGTAELPTPCDCNGEVGRWSPAAPNMKMEKRSSVMLPSVAVDWCPETGGFYLDPGEITKLRALDYENRMLDNEEYREMRNGFVVLKSKCRGNLLGAFNGGSGLDRGGLCLHFRVAVFFNSVQHDICIRTWSWFDWLRSFVSEIPGRFMTGNRAFDSRFVCTSQNPEAAILLLSEDICKELLALSETRIYHEKCRVELNSSSLLFTEGPYAAATEPSVDDWEFAFWDKSEPVLNRIVDIVGRIEQDAASRLSCGS